jgi:hypothetical protein
LAKAPEISAQFCYPTCSIASDSFYGNSICLTASAGDKELLRQTGKLDYFRKEMKKMDAPKGVSDNLDQIAAIAGKSEITDRDISEILKLMKNIQTMLA